MKVHLKLDDREKTVCVDHVELNDRLPDNDEISNVLEAKLFIRLSENEITDGLDELDFHGRINCHHIGVKAPLGFVLFYDQELWSSRSSGSKALYPGYWDLRSYGLNGGFLLQILATGNGTEIAETTTHFHRNTTERFYNIYGDCNLWTSKTDEATQLNGPVTIPPETDHFLYVSKGLAINIIRMDGPLHIRCLADHWYRARASDNGPRKEPRCSCGYC